MATEKNNVPAQDAAQPPAPASRKTVANILTADLLVVDQLITLPSAGELAKSSDKLRDRYEQADALLESLLAKKGLKHGDKISINEEDFRELSIAVAGLPGRMEPGGATADIITTARHLLGEKMHVDFLGISGRNETNDNLVLNDLKRNSINVAPGATEGAKSATSFIFTHPDGKHTMVTYPGNAAEMLKPEMITDDRVSKSDTVLIPLSLWSKFDSPLPDTLLSKALTQDKNIIVSIPKQARFDRMRSEDIHQRVIPNADIIVADADELARWYKTDGDTQQAIQNLQADMAKRDALRASGAKAARSKPATAFIKHHDDSATVLVAQSPPGMLPFTPATRYEVSAPQVISGHKHSIGVDDAMYAGFITALASNIPPPQAAEFAMDVAKTKFLYDSVRIPGPVGADKATQERWQGLQSGLGEKLAGLESAIGLAKTGVPNEVDQTLPRTKGQQMFDFILYPLLANIGVFALSTFVTYHSSFNQNKANAFVRRSSWFKDQLTKIPGLGKNPQMVRNLNMVIWSFVDGSLAAPLVAGFESKRQNISRWIDDRLGTTPEDKSVYDKEIKRSFMDVLTARGTTFAAVIATYFALNAKVFPRSTQEGILAETVANSGIFKRETVQSINGMVFDAPGKKIGGWLATFPSINNWAKKVSNNQLKGMAQKTGTVAREATQMDARFQIEGLVNTGLFELAYTSLCTAGLYFFGKLFATNRHNKEVQKEVAKQLTGSSSESPATGGKAIEVEVLGTTPDNKEIQPSWIKKVAMKTPFEKAASHLEALDNSRSAALQIGS